MECVATALTAEERRSGVRSADRDIDFALDIDKRLWAQPRAPIRRGARASASQHRSATPRSRNRKLYTEDRGNVSDLKQSCPSYTYQPISRTSPKRDTCQVHRF